MSDSALCSENMKVNETHSSCSRRTYINYVLTSSISSNLLQSYFSMLESLTQLAPKTVPESIFLVDFYVFSGLRFHGLSHRMKSCQTATYEWSSYVEPINVYPGYQRTKRLNKDLMEVKKFSLSFPSQSESTLMTTSCRWHLVSEMMLNLHADYLGLPAVSLCSVWWYHFTLWVPVFCLVAPLKTIYTYQ